MANAINGSVTTSASITQALDAGAGGRITAYNVPIQPSETESYTAGTGANMANKVAQAAGSAAAAVVDIDLSTIVCVDGSTGFTHIREVLVFNDDTIDAHTLLMGLGTTPFAPWLAGTTPTIEIRGGASERKSKPLGTLGWVVDSTHKIFRLDPGSNTVAYRVVFLGD